MASQWGKMSMSSHWQSSLGIGASITCQWRVNNRSLAGQYRIIAVSLTLYHSIHEPKILFCNVLHSRLKCEMWNVTVRLHMPPAVMFFRARIFEDLCVSLVTLLLNQALAGEGNWVMQGQSWLFSYMSRFFFSVHLFAKHHARGKCFSYRDLH